MRIVSAATSAPVSSNYEAFLMSSPPMNDVVFDTTHHFKYFEFAVHKIQAEALRSLERNAR